MLAGTNINLHFLCEHYGAEHVALFLICDMIAQRLRVSQRIIMGQYSDFAAKIDCHICFFNIRINTQLYALEIVNIHQTCCSTYGKNKIRTLIQL